MYYRVQEPTAIGETAPWALNYGSGEGGDEAKGGGEELVTAFSKQFRRSRGEKPRSTKLGLVVLTIESVHMRMRASKERASKGSVCGRAIAAACNEFRRSRGVKSTRLGLVVLTVGSVHTSEVGPGEST